MSHAWSAVGTVAAGLLLAWVTLVVVLLVMGRRDENTGQLKEAIRLVPDIIRLLRRLAADDNLPRGVRVRLLLLLAYLAMPIDLVPDFIPIAGYADDAILIVLTLRSVTRRAGPEALERHWPGTPEGLRAVRRLTGLGEPPT